MAKAQTEQKKEQSLFLPHIREGLLALRERADEGRAGTYRYTQSLSEMESQMEVFTEVANTTLETEGRTFTLDDQNALLVRYLIAYTNEWEETFTELSEELTGTEGDLRRPIFLSGEKGVGKTLHMQVLAKFAQVMRLRNGEFLNVSASELLNYMRVKGNLDYYTYNIGRAEMVGGRLSSAKPWGVCLHDLGLELDSSHKQRIYGTDLVAVLNDFLMARYELFQNQGLMTHITTNLTVAQFSKAYPPRVRDRFKQYNYVTMRGESRR